MYIAFMISCYFYISINRVEQMGGQIDVVVLILAYEASLLLQHSPQGLVHLFSLAVQERPRGGMTGGRWTQVTQESW